MPGFDRNLTFDPIRTDTPRMQTTPMDPLSGPLIADLSSLLSQLGLVDLAALSAVVPRYANVIAWIPSADEQDCLPDRLRICVASRSFYLTFPFTAVHLWDAIDDFEAEIETQRQTDVFWLGIH